MIILPINAILQGQSYTRPQVDAALALKQNVLTFDDTPTANSNNPVKSSGIKTELEGKMPVATNQDQAANGSVLTISNGSLSWQLPSSGGDVVAAAANSYAVTLLASNWSDHTYVIATPVNATITTTCDGILGLAPNASAAQVEAFQLAKIIVTSQDSNGVTVVARGQVPTINLNLELTLFMKADYYTKTEEDALLATKAPLGSPAFTGNPTAPTPASGDNDTSIATTAFVQGEGQKKPNPNLLDNWYMRGTGSHTGDGNFPINQRRATTYSSQGYTIDRWYATSNRGEISFATNCIRIKKTADSGSYVIQQKLAQPVVGQCTFSILTNGTITGPMTLYIRDSSSTSLANQSFSVTSGSAQVYSVTYDGSGNPAKEVVIALSSSVAQNEYINIYGVKLERGGIQTLAVEESGAWKMTEIPDYGIEILKCETSSGDSADLYSNCRAVTNKATFISSAQDLDDIKQPGVYWWTNAPANAPTTSGIGSWLNGWLYVYRSDDGSRIMQEALYNPASTAETPSMVRMYGNNSWSSWRTIDRSLNADLALHVNPVSGNDSNDGLTAATALKTTAAAMDKIPADMSGRIATIYLAEGTYSAALNISDRRSSTIWVQKESSAATANIKIPGARFADNAHTTILITNITFTDSVTINNHARIGEIRMNDCIFDNAPVTCNAGPYVWIGSSRWRNISGTALTCSYGYCAVSGSVVEQSVTGTGIAAGDCGIVTISTRSYSNTATTPYATSYSGRIFVGGSTYKENSGVLSNYTVTTGNYGEVGNITGVSGQIVAVRLRQRYTGTTWSNCTNYAAIPYAYNGNIRGFYIESITDGARPTNTQFKVDILYDSF